MTDVKNLICNYSYINNGLVEFKQILAIPVTCYSVYCSENTL